MFRPILGSAGWWKFRLFPYLERKFLIGNDREWFWHEKCCKIFGFLWLGAPSEDDGTLTGRSSKKRRFACLEQF